MGYLSRVFTATERANYRGFLDMLPAGRGGRLLDIGTHDGAFTEAIAKRVGAAEVHGLELLLQHAERARERGIQAVVGDLDQGLPFPDAAFEVVTANQVIEHVRRTDVFLTELRRVLSPDGICVLGTNNLSSWHNIISLALGWQPAPQHVSDEVIVGNPINPQHGRQHEDLGRTHLRLFTVRALRELAAHHGLDAVAWRTVGFYPLPPRVATVAARIDPVHAAFTLMTLRRTAVYPYNVFAGTS